jgi:hypothetical protein
MRPKLRERRYLSNHKATKAHAPDAKEKFYRPISNGGKIADFMTSLSCYRNYLPTLQINYRAMQIHFNSLILKNNFIKFTR